MRVRLKKWCKRHAHLLVFFGAFIVFSTFVVKEGIGEHFREVADNIDRARDMYSIRADINDSFENIRLTFREHDLSATRISDSQLYDSELMGAHESLDRIDSVIAILHTLSDHLPKDEAREKSFSMFKGDRADAGREVMATYPILVGRLTQKQLRAPFETHPVWIYKPRHPESPDTGAVATVSNSRATAILTSISNFKADVDAFALETFGRAEAIRQRNEELSRWAWWTSAVLFAVGWGLGLIGKLYGVPEASGGE